MRLFHLLLFAMSMAALAYGQNSAPLQPNRGRSSDFLKAISPGSVAPIHNLEKLSTTSALDSFFIALMTSRHIPGLAACIVKKDSILWQGYYGYADIPKNKPVTDSTSFMLASISKTVVATALMQLYEQGKFKLDDSINAYLPFTVRNPTFPGIPITFRMLLTHTSSIQDNWDVMFTVYGDDPTPLAAYCHDYFSPGGQYYNPGVNFYPYAPGNTWNYSNMGAVLAAYLVEAISGVEFSRYCKDSVFARLHMSHTGWFLRDLDTNLVARPYTYVIDPKSGNGGYYDNGLLGGPDYPDAALRTTLPSLARFLMANINGGASRGVRILDSATVRLMRTVYVPNVVVNSLPYEWGLVWYKEKWTGRDLWGHQGGLSGVMTAMWLSEPDNAGIIFLANIDPGLWFKTIVTCLIDEAHSLTVGVHKALANIPERVQLLQNYPNPFNPSTTIRYALPKASMVRLSVYDILGREVAVLVNERKNAGSYEVKFDGSNLASGIYLYRLQAGDYVASKMMLALK